MFTSVTQLEIKIRIRPYLEEEYIAAIYHGMVYTQFQIVHLK